MSDKKVSSKMLKDLIEEVLSEKKLNIALDKSKNIGSIRKNLGYSVKAGYPIDEPTLKRILSTEPELQFDYEDTKAFTYRKLEQDNPLVQKGLYNAGEKAVANSSANIRLMHVFLNKPVWSKMTTAEKNKFKKEFIQFKNFGVLKQVPAFYEQHKKDYDKFVKQYQKLFPSQKIKQTVVDDPSITSPNIQTALGDKAQMTQEQKNYFDRFFALNNTGSDLSSRIKALTNFSTLIAGAEGEKDQVAVLKNQSKEEKSGQVNLAKVSQNFIVNIGVLDMFNNFAKNIDFGAGAYFFETFLAYLSGGVAGGKISGVAGGMGEADFLKADGTKGSAKYMQKDAEVKQSWKNFVEGFPVEYVIAYKSDETGGKTSDVEKLYKIDLYKVLVEKTAPTEVSINGKAYPVSEILSGGDIVLSKKTKDWEFIGAFIMPQTNKKTLTQFAQEAAKSIDKSVEKAFTEFKTLIDDLKELKTQTQDYATEPTITKGNKALNKSEEFATNLKTLASSYGQEITKTPLQEQKITSDFLKKIIQETLKK